MFIELALKKGKKLSTQQLKTSHINLVFADESSCIGRIH